MWRDLLALLSESSPPAVRHSCPQSPNLHDHLETNGGVFRSVWMWEGVATASKEDVLDGMRWICTSVVLRPLLTGGSRGTVSWKICSSSDSTRFSTSPPPSASTGLHSTHQGHDVRTHLQLQEAVGNNHESHSGSKLPVDSYCTTRTQNAAAFISFQSWNQKFLNWLHIQKQSKKKWIKIKQPHSTRKSFLRCCRAQNKNFQQSRVCHCEFG